MLEREDELGRVDDDVWLRKRAFALHQREEVAASHKVHQEVERVLRLEGVVQRHDERVRLRGELLQDLLLCDRLGDRSGAAAVFAADTKNKRGTHKSSERENEHSGG